MTKSKCLEIRVSFEGERDSFKNKIVEKAKKCNLEGILEVKSKSELLISVCGTTHEIEQFIDFFYEEHTNLSAVIIEIEPFIKEKDYRGVFRVIE